MKLRSDISHTSAGILFFDLPVTIILAFVFHNIVRDALFHNLPSFLKLRFSNLRFFNWNKHFRKHWLVVVISALTGATSHIAWDSFTHSGGYFVTMIPEMKEVITVPGVGIPVFKVLQHAGTVIGASAIAFVIYKMPGSERTAVNTDYTYWLVVLILTAITFTIRVLAGLNIRQYGDILVTGISALLIALILTPVVLRRRVISENNQDAHNSAHH